MNKREKKLLDVFRRLPQAAADSLLEFADFLSQRHAQSETIPESPLDIPRPEQESVIAAVKRLSKTYPMLNKDTMLHETSGKVAQHLLQGRDAVEVIDELEVIFQAQYEKQTQLTEKDDDA